MNARSEEPATHEAAFRESMARLAATVHVVTARHGGRPFGMTITAACSLSLDPMSVVLCINRAAASHDAFMGSGRLCLNMLGQDHADVAARFAGATGHRGEDRFDPGRWTLGGAAGPVFDEAVAALDCRIALIQPFGTHSILGCTVDSVRLGSKRPALLYADRRYATLGAPSPL
jgi:flavin reductase